MKHKMDYKTVPIEKLKPDPSQPRKYIDQDSIVEMSISIKNEGLINPIEVDDDFVIITGERRWRASTLAGLKEVPVKVLIGISPKDRFIRQVQENIHQNTMSPLDTAEALEKIRTWVASSAVEVARGKFHQSDRYKKGVKELHDLLGTPESTLVRYLDLLGETGEMKEALKKPGFQMTKIELMKDAPEKYKEKLKHLVATQTNIPRDTVTHLMTALRRANKYGEDKLVDKLLLENYEGLTSLQALNKINKIIPDEESRVKEPADAVKFVHEKVVSLMELLDKNPLASFDEFHRPMVVRHLNVLGFYITNYLKGTDFSEIKLEDRKLLDKRL